jgi:hypothetical protein
MKRRKKTKLISLNKYAVNLQKWSHLYAELLRKWAGVKFPNHRTNWWGFILLSKSTSILGLISVTLKEPLMI